MTGRYPRDLESALGAVLDNTAIALEEQDVGVVNLAAFDALRADFRRASADGRLSHTERVRLMRDMRLLERGLTRAYGLDVIDLDCIKTAAGHLDAYTRTRAARQSGPQENHQQPECIAR